MACEEHLQLASFIKSVHKDLRDQMSDKDPDKVWDEHLENDELLGKYAAAMKELATEFWVNEDNSRVFWIYNQIENYFFKGGRKHEHSRDYKFAKRKGVLLDSCDESDLSVDESDRLTVLDVGSCYNPFKQFETLDVLAIDIAPAQNDVFKCDFLKVNISEQTDKTDSSVNSLGKESYQVIIFCLLLGRNVEIILSILTFKSRIHANSQSKI